MLQSKICISVDSKFSEDQAAKAKLDKDVSNEGRINLTVAVSCLGHINVELTNFYFIQRISEKKLYEMNQTN